MNKRRSGYLFARLLHLWSTFLCAKKEKKINENLKTFNQNMEKKGQAECVQVTIITKLI